MAREYKDVVVGLDIGTSKVMAVVAEVLPDTAHLMMLDTRWEMVAEQVAAWLQREFVAAVAVSE